MPDMNEAIFGSAMKRIGKYSCREIERRFLLRHPPAGLSGRAADLRILDHYLPGTRLRLRRIERQAGGDVVLKLGQKFRGPGQDAMESTMTNLVLNEREYETLRQLGGREVVKYRYAYPYAGRRYAIDVFHGRLEGLVLAEVECERLEEAAGMPRPDFAVIEVTNDSAFTGGELATLTSEGLSALLRSHFGGR
jgi:CYTH domain-containing protein